ncbi:MAG TPA: hypothetical protein VF629_18245 [Hymenobacter sp.]|jgi:hypothetical protein|uniref:hypothetical protein n=1 Tax=Hymenobacter sp. TaxID=1898978 RepID=UPI002ED9097F
MEKTAADFAHIPGWGIDADPKNEPTYPNRHRTGQEHDGYTWQRPTQQVPDHEVLHSIERPNLSAVVGNAPAPTGLSGMIRRFAFKFSENEYLHWLPLLAADKINVVEGIIEDISKGTVPNIWAEKGYNAQWKHDLSGMLVKIATAAAVTAGLVYLALPKNGRSHKASATGKYKSASKPRMVSL